MAKAKFYYDSDTLSYQPIGKNKKKIFRNTILYILAVILIGLLGFAAFSTILKSPSERSTLRELNNLKFNYELLEKRMTESTAILEEIQQRDNNVYRVIFEAKPISEEERSAGFGGVNRYKNLEGFKNSDLITEATQKMDILAKRLVVQSKSLDEIVKLAKNKAEMLASIPAIQPVANKDLKRMASGYGMRIHPIYKTRRMHWGMDFSAPQGSNIYATGDGVIKSAKKSRKGFGNHIVIDHGFGYETTYAHMNKFFVRRGQKVKRGDLIGLVGSTGSSTAPHLHYEVKKGNQKMNPVYFYHNDLTPEEYETMLILSSQENQSLD
ncbi:murein DD-endopeptidase MepM/ murein hydrolase activator NlpD [Wenyingzhuangia heitensis]|uniref:Murein DD-endopeptidase MepM/ murein hydrolase activator NlpD n=1 Tax=Wenyingzhuangia heitensis TaxID=1487859 RepID=A0ABX0UEK2_9FLAO|nr:M23 family metallopeptidase [Wenyingzhuangia heitensis]NIJ46300.1 murein DD-endopeptidase MepM/ murein hydrolase activator NlpD [Wenyingzhuangia heitensis]